MPVSVCIELLLTETCRLQHLRQDVVQCVCFVQFAFLSKPPIMRPAIARAIAPALRVDISGNKTIAFGQLSQNAAPGVNDQ